MTQAAVPVPRLVATDLDGTLLRPDGQVSAWTTQVLADLDDAGIPVLFVTARPPRWIAAVADLVGRHGQVICLNGAIEFEPGTGRVLRDEGMTAEVVRALLVALRAALPGVAFAVERATGFAAEAGYRHEHALPTGEPGAVWADGALEDLLDVGPPTPTCKILVRCADVPDAVLARTVAEVLGDRAGVANSGAAGLVEVSPAGLTKAVALERWAARRGIAPRDVWAFGDMPNDLEMLRWAGRGIAVATAHPELLAVADEVCGAPEDDGVAQRLAALLPAGGSGRVGHQAR